MSHEKFKFTKSHEWIETEGDVLRVGISEHAQRVLGDIVFVELPEVGTELKKDDELLVVESPKAAAEVYMPVDGEIIEINDALDGTPDLINSSPYEDGWIVKVKVSNAADLDALMSHDDYQKMVEEGD